MTARATSDPDSSLCHGCCCERWLPLCSYRSTPGVLDLIQESIAEQDGVNAEIGGEAASTKARCVVLSWGPIREHYSDNDVELLNV